MPDADPPVSLPDTERQYHIDLGPGEVADYILLPGDPDRTDRLAALLDDVEVQRRHREFHCRHRHAPRAARLGRSPPASALTTSRSSWPRSWPSRRGPRSCASVPVGSLREDIAIGDLVVTTGALRMEATTSYYVDDGYPAVADYAAVAALLEAAARTGHRAHLGLTATAPGFYGAQGRPIPQLPLRFPDLAERLAAQGVVNFEMEASAVLTLAALAGCRAGVVCTVFAQRTSGAFASAEQRWAAEEGLMETGLEALHVLAEMDEQRSRAGELHWRPSHWAPKMAL